MSNIRIALFTALGVTALATLVWLGVAEYGQQRTISVASQPAGARSGILAVKPTRLAQTDPNSQNGTELQPTEQQEEQQEEQQQQQQQSPPNP